MRTRNKKWKPENRVWLTLSHIHTSISSCWREQKRKVKCVTLTHVLYKHTCCRGNRNRQTGKQKAASVSLYSFVGEDGDEARVRANILNAARPIAWSLSHIHTYTHSMPLQMCSLAVALFSIICKITHGAVCNFFRDNQRVMILNVCLVQWKQSHSLKILHFKLICISWFSLDKKLKE